MNVLAVVTVYGQDPHRLRAAELVREWVLELGWSLSTTKPLDTGAPACDRSRARNVFLSSDPTSKLLPGTDVLVFLDCDSLIPHEQLEVAAELAATRPGMVYAYDEYRRLSRASTEALEPGTLETAFAITPELVFPNSGSTGAVAITPACFDGVGGYDEAYVHGCEDLDFAYRCSLLWPIRRVPGPLAHLWHPRPAVEPESWPADLERYAAATRAQRPRLVQGVKP